MGNLTSRIITTLLTLPGILIGISFHEFGHAYAAYKLGDESQSYRGRLTINPFKHLDPFGFILLLVAGFGWAKPVITESKNFKKPLRDDCIVALAGPVANFIMAIFFIILMFIISQFLEVSEVTVIIWQMLFLGARINLGLMVFNLIPIPPLDGHHVLGNIGGSKVWNFYYKYADYLRLGLMVAIIFNFIGMVLGPVVQFIYDSLFYAFYLLFNLF